ncbi:Mut7-C RNAse domain-containing protein [Azotobacter beijerinckii]|nr:Mut7-C RNAse domain-containing protein [Azotobacter beijerinckii]
MVSATFRFYEELNDFLPLERRRQAFTCPCARAATVKHMIEALGVPHTEVELVLINGESADFARSLRDGDRVAVYPRVETLDITPLLRVRARPLRRLSFVADAHLGGLARLLRMCGFDTLYDNHYEDGQIAAIAAEQARPRLPPRIAALYSRFLACDACQRLYWEGSHWRSMCALLAPLLDTAPPGPG